LNFSGARFYNETMLPLRVFINKPSRSRLLSIVVVVVLILVAGIRVESKPPLRSLRGTVYYSNNTPSNLDDFPVELLTTNQQTKIAETTLTGAGHFYLDEVPAGKYLLRMTNLNNCVLTFRVDLRRQSITNVRIVMDAACAHLNGKIDDLPKN